MRIAAIFLLTIILFSCASVGTVNRRISLPESAEAISDDIDYNRGWEYLRRGQPDRARKSFLKSDVPEDIRLAAIGYVELVQGLPAQARNAFTRALDLNPENLQAGLGLAAVYEKLNDSENAFLVYGQLRTRFPDNNQIKLNYDRIQSTATQLHLRNAERAQGRNNIEYIGALEKAAFFSPQRLDLKLQIGEFHYGEGHYEKAATYFEEILELSPGHKLAMLRAADSYTRQERFDAALVLLDRLSRLDPGNRDIISRLEDVRTHLQQSDLPDKFKRIFFQIDVKREEMAALIGYYFKDYLKLDRQPEIISDIRGSSFMEEIILVCTLGIMKKRPDHTFDRFTKMSRADAALVLHSLIRYLEKTGYRLQYNPSDEISETRDIFQTHKNYGTIQFLVRAQILQLDSAGRFNPMATLTPNDTLVALRRMLSSIQDR